MCQTETVGVYIGVYIHLNTYRCKKSMQAIMQHVQRSDGALRVMDVEVCVHVCVHLYVCGCILCMRNTPAYVYI